MSRRRSAEIQVFSLSFLDLLCCGMAGVTILWLLTTQGEEAYEETRYGYIHVWQSGVWHLNPRLGGQVIARDLRDGREVDLLDAAASAPYCESIGLLFSVTQENMVAAAGGLDRSIPAGRMTVGFDRKTKPLELLVRPAICRAPNDIHTIHVLIETQARRQRDAFVFTDRTSLNTAHSAASGSSDPATISFSRTVAAMPVPATDPNRNRTEFRFIIRGGRVRYVAAATGDAEYKP